LRHDGLLHEIIEGRMKGKPTRRRRRIQMLHDLASDGGFVVLKWAAEDRYGDTERGCQKPADDGHGWTMEALCLRPYSALLYYCDIV